MVLVIGFAIASNHGVVNAQTKYGVTVKVSKASALTKATTYSWISSQPSAIRAVNAQIVAAVDRELAARGFTKATSGTGDVLATYASGSRTDVDLKTKAKDGERPEYPVGTLVVDLRDPTTRQPLFRVRIDKPIVARADELEPVIDAAVAAMFAKYPPRTATKP
jgi:hypothetical protein